MAALAVCTTSCSRPWPAGSPHDSVSARIPLVSRVVQGPADGPGTGPARAGRPARLAMPAIARQPAPGAGPVAATGARPASGRRPPSPPDHRGLVAGGLLRYLAGRAAAVQGRAA